MALRPGVAPGGFAVGARPVPKRLSPDLKAQQFRGKIVVTVSHTRWASYPGSRKASNCPALGGTEGFHGRGITSGVSVAKASAGVESWIVHSDAAERNN